RRPRRARSARAGHHLADALRRLFQSRLPPADRLAHPVGRVAGRDPDRGRHSRGRVPARRRHDQEPGLLPARPASTPPSRRALGPRVSPVSADTIAAHATLLLFAGGALAPVLVLSLLAGAAIGAVYSLQGVYAYELIDPRHLGALLGIAQAVFAAGGALGPVAA